MTNKKFQLLFYVVRLGYPGIHVTARQPLSISRQETGNWGANSFVSYNNLFGMTAPASRETTATNKGSGKVATFRSPVDSMRDFFLWCEAFNLKDDAALDSHIRALRYNNNPKYPAAIDTMTKQLTASGEYLPAELFEPVVVGGAAVVSVAALTALILNLQD